MSHRKRTPEQRAAIVDRKARRGVEDPPRHACPHLDVLRPVPPYKVEMCWDPGCPEYGVSFYCPSCWIERRIARSGGSSP